MRPFGSRSRRAGGARPMKGARVPVPERPPDAVLGRAMRGLIGATADSRDGRRSVSAARPTPIPTAARRTGGVSARPAGRSRPRFRLFAPARAAGLLGMLGAGFLFTLVTGPTAFGLSRTELPKLAWTDADAVTATLAVTPGSNVFRLDTEPLEAALRSLPGVAAAQVSVALPDAALVVRIQERVPILAWQLGDKRYLADAAGTVFAIADAARRLPAGVAVVDDRRSTSVGGLSIGAHIDPIDLDVATRLGSLTPGGIGSAADRLTVIVTDDEGFELAATGAASGSWIAVFGFYSPATRSTDMIPAQVRLLGSLLEGREASVRRVILASGTDGTYIPRATPKASTR